MHIPMRHLRVLTQTPSPAAPSTRNTMIPHLHPLIGEAEITGTPCLLPHSQVHTHTHAPLQQNIQTSVYPFTSVLCVELLDVKNMHVPIHIHIP